MRPAALRRPLNSSLAASGPCRLARPDLLPSSRSDSTPRPRPRYAVRPPDSARRASGPCSPSRPTAPDRRSSFLAPTSPRASSLAYPPASTHRPVPCHAFLPRARQPATARVRLTPCSTRCDSPNRACATPFLSTSPALAQPRQSIPTPLPRSGPPAPALPPTPRRASPSRPLRQPTPHFGPRRARSARSRLAVPHPC